MRPWWTSGTSRRVIHKGELAYRPVASVKDVLNVGDEIDVYVERVEDGDGNPVLSSVKLMQLEPGLCLKRHIKTMKPLRLQYRSGSKVVCW